ncbi:hypothetical protein AB6D11_02920 [Vibrio splendidus]
MSHELLNFHNLYRGRLRYTYVVTPSASACFGVTANEGKLYLGVPNSLHGSFKLLKLIKLCIIEGGAGIHLQFFAGSRHKGKEHSLRIYQTKHIIDAIKNYNEITVVPFGKGGVVNDKDLTKDIIKLPIELVQEMYWEK